MSYLKMATCQERGRHWQDQAARLPLGPDRDACLALAGGYDDLIALLEKLKPAPG